MSVFEENELKEMSPSWAKRKEKKKSHTRTQGGGCVTCRNCLCDLVHCPTPAFRDSRRSERTLFPLREGACGSPGGDRSQDKCEVGEGRMAGGKGGL